MILHRDILKLLYLSKWHDVLFNVRPSHLLRLFIIICYHYGDGWIIFPYAVNEYFELVIAQKGLGGYGNKSTNIVLLNGNKKTQTTKMIICGTDTFNSNNTIDNDVTVHKPLWYPEL